MKTFHYNGYSADQGGTMVSSFWLDMHIEDFRADKPIQTWEDLKAQVERFKEDRAAFDVTNYDLGPKFLKANREYESLLPAVRNIEVFVFMYQGKKYRTRAANYFSTKKRIEAYADEILERYTEQVECLVSDATNEIVAELRVIRKLNRKFDQLI